MNQIATARGLVELRVFVFYDGQKNIHVAQCLETGSVATADDEETLKEMMVELLQEEISFALQHNNLKNLFSAPAPIETWKKWFEFSKEGRNVEVLRIPVDSTEISLHEQSISNAVSVVTA